MSLIDIKSLTLDELKIQFKQINQPSFKALQVYRWLHRGVESFDEMSDQSKEFRKNLAEQYYISVANIVKKQVSIYDSTTKYLFSFSEGEFVESVLMEYKHGYSICISTQIGCKMGCTFCATGKDGFLRNLTASEILAQVQAAQKDANIRISNIVLMGMGEPLDNYENVLRFLELVSSEEGMNIGMRHISLSTCGIVDKIYDLAEKKLQLTLSISLHAPNDKIREKTMPINKKWNIDDLLKACRYYIKQTGRRISFEYAMINGVNDSDECARALASRLKGMICHVNLIPVNEVMETTYKRTSNPQMQRFMGILQKANINTTIRRTLGSDIDASCGQLRQKHKAGSEVIENL